MSSINTMTTLGALSGALTSNRGGAFALRASISVICAYFGSGIGRIVRSSASVEPWIAAGPLPLWSVEHETHNHVIAANVNAFFIGFLSWLPLSMALTPRAY